MPLSGEKMMPPAFSVTFDRIFVKLAGNGDRPKRSNEIEFGPDQIIHFGAIALERGNFFPLIYNGENDVSTFSQLLWIQSSSNLQVTKTDIKCWMDSNSDRISDQSLWSYMPLSGEKKVSNFSQSPVSRFAAEIYWIPWKIIPRSIRTELWWFRGS